MLNVSTPHTISLVVVTIAVMKWFVLNNLNYSPLREAKAGIQADAETMEECFLLSQTS